MTLGLFCVLQNQNAPYNQLFTCGRTWPVTETPFPPQHVFIAVLSHVLIFVVSLQNCAVCPAAYNTGTYRHGVSCHGQQNMTDTEYYAVVNATGIAASEYGRAEAARAAEKFTAFLTALSRYDCESSYIYKSSYSAWNCDDCRKASLPISTLARI